MTQHVPVAQQDALANREAVKPLPEISTLTALKRYIIKSATIIGLEIRKIRHDPTDLFTRAIQPMLWLLIFGEVLARVRGLTSGSTSYIDFLAPGILAQSVLFIAIFSGIAIIWERDLGIIHKFLASPTPRSALVLGKALSAGVRGLSQAIIIYLLALLLGVHMNWNPLALLGVFVMIMLGASTFATFSLVIACLVRTRERFMGIGQVLTMPLFFASNAIYPIAIMPAWLQVVAHGNPLSYEVDALRSLMLANGTINSSSLLIDYVVMIAVTIVLVAIAARLYPRVAR